MTPGKALELLSSGNMRFVAGTPKCAAYGPTVAEHSDEPRPFAVVLGCSDPRVPIEIIFDQPLGSLFVVRVAGNYVNGDNLASIEFAVDSLRASLVLVLGHSRCGALSAALRYVRDGTSPRGHVPAIVTALAPSIQAAQGFPGDWLETAIAHNVERGVEAIIAGSDIISNAVDSGNVRVAGGVYDVATGWVAFV
jgi:carbonic anhydrase